MADETCQVVSRMVDITEQDDKLLAGARKEIRNSLTVIIPENPFPEISVESYPPLKFSWVIPKKLAAMAFPRNKENLQFLVEQGINHLITLTEKKPPLDGITGLRWTHLVIEEFEVPSVEQIKKFIEVCKQAEKSDEVLGVHCRQGRGRSGVMLACYLTHFHRFAPDQALNVVQMIRPGSCDRPENEEAVGAYFEYLTQNNPLKFGVSSEVIDQLVDSAREINKTII